MAALLGACAAPPEFLRRPTEPMAWPGPEATPRIELEYGYGGTDDAVRHPGFFGGLLRMIAGEETVHFVSPTGMARCGDLLWIADAGDGCVHRLSLATGEHERCRGHDDHPFTTPIGIAAEPSGRVFVTDAATGYLTVLDSDGDAIECIGGPDSFQRPTGICYDARREHLLVVDTVACCILLLDRDGHRLAAHGTRGTADGEFNFPTNIALASDGRVLVVDSLNFRVQLLTPELEPIRSFGRVGRGPGDFANPKGIAVDSADNVYVVDSMFDNFQIFDLEGQLLLAVATTGHGLGELYLPTGIHIDGDDRIYVADAGNSRIQVMKVRGIGKGTP